MTEPQQKSLEDEIEKVLPKKKANPMISPYGVPERRIYSGPTQRNNIVELNYRAFEFEKPPRESEFTYAFRLFYYLKTGRGNHVAMQKAEDCIKVPKDSPRITFGADASMRHIYFHYKEGDEESEQIVDEFIRKLREEDENDYY